MLVKFLCKLYYSENVYVMEDHWRYLSTVNTGSYKDDLPPRFRNSYLLISYYSNESYG